VAHRTVDRHQAGGLRGAARREDAEGGRAHGEAVAPGVPVLGRDRGGQAPPQVLQRAPLAEARAPERTLVQVGDPVVPGRLHMPGRERRPVPGQQQPGEDGVLRVVRAGRSLGHVPRDAAPACADLGRLHVLGGRPQRVTDGESQQRAARPIAETGGVPGGGDRGNAGNRSHDGASPSRGPGRSEGPFADLSPPSGAAEPRAAQRHPVDICAQVPTDERSAVKAQVSTAFLAGEREISGVAWVLSKSRSSPSSAFEQHFGRPGHGHHRDRGGASRGAP
jgi:hypothetical protein